VASDDDILKNASEHFRRLASEGKLGGSTSSEEAEVRQRQQIKEKEVRVIGVFKHPQGAAPFVLVRDARGRNLPIFIGQPEAMAISLALEGEPTNRPLTHDLMKILVSRLGASVDFILVDDLYNNVFYAKMVLRHGAKQMEIDCRSSDAIAMALRFKVPIYVADHVLEEGQCEVTEE
jgi:bifunctional DNase/RNase